MIEALSAMLKKDLLMFARDKAGLLLLFLMPAVLVTLMAYLQNDTYKAILESKVPIIILDRDCDSIGRAVREGIAQSGVFDITVAKPTATNAQIEQEVLEGDYRLGIVIPRGCTQFLRSRVQKGIAAAFGTNEAKDSTPGSTGTPCKSNHCATNEEQSSRLKVFVDPVAKNSFVSSLTATLRQSMATEQTAFILNEVRQQASLLSPLPLSQETMPAQLLDVEEITATKAGGNTIPDAVQHNVPAWGLFAIFFIVVSLSGGIIREREQGCYVRIRMAPGGYTVYIVSKAITCCLVAIAQVAVIVLIGRLIFPLIGMHAFETAGRGPSLAFVALCTAVAAAGMGLAIGTLAKTSQQASSFGSVAVVILSAIGGLWIPMFVMPQAIRVFCQLSPMNWGLQAFYGILLRQAPLSSVLPHCLLLLLFGAAGLAIAMTAERRRWK